MVLCFGVTGFGEDCSALAVPLGECFCFSPGIRILLVWELYSDKVCIYVGGVHVVKLLHF